VRKNRREKTRREKEKHRKETGEKLRRKGRMRKVIKKRKQKQGIA
jgi:hypothetical protein